MKRRIIHQIIKKILTSAIRRFIVKLGTAQLTGIVFALLGSGSALADCGPFSNLAFWSGMNHDSVKTYVDTKMGGDWQSQIEQMEARQVQLKDIYARKSGVELRYKGKIIKLFDDELASYIEQAETRLNIVKCLAQSEELDELPEMGTASGPDETPADPSQ